MDIRREQCPRWKSSEDHGPHFWNAGGKAPFRCGGWGQGYSKEKCSNNLHHEPHKWSEYNHPGEEEPSYCPGQDAVSEIVGGGFVTLMGEDPYAPKRERTSVPISWDGEGWVPNYADGRENRFQPVGIEDALQKAWREEMDFRHDLAHKFGLFIVAVLEEHPDMVDKIKEIEPDPLELRQLITNTFEF